MSTLGPDVRWSAATADADVILFDQLRGNGPATVGRHCPRCGSSEHGRPWARVGAVDVPVSVSRSGAHLVTVVADGSVRAIGIDVEAVDPGPAGWPLQEMLAPGEQLPPGPYAEARLWATKEAILKADGTGLARPMTDLRLSEVVAEVRELDAPAGFVAALALRR